MKIEFEITEEGFARAKSRDEIIEEVDAELHALRETLIAKFVAEWRRLRSEP